MDIFPSESRLNPVRAVSEWRRGFSLIALSVMLIGMLAACADNDQNRRFANEPIPTENLLSQPTFAVSTLAPQPTQPPATPATLDQLLGNVGQTPRIFVQAGSEIFAIEVDGTSRKRVFNAMKQTIVAFAGTHDGMRLAILVASEKTGRLSVQVVDHNGKVQSDKEDHSDASPVPAGSGRYRLAWSPNDDRLLISKGTGGIYEVQDSGDIKTILDPASAPSPRAISWSPTGGSIAYVDAGPGGKATGLYVASADAIPADPIAVIPPVEGRRRQIQEIAWAPAGGSIYYSERAANGDFSVGGDLFSVPVSGGTPVLIVSAGGGTQAAVVGNFLTSPDGSAIVYTVLMPADGGGVVTQLFVQQLNGPSFVRLVSGRGGIDGLVFSTAGLGWSTTRADEDNVQVTVWIAQRDASVKAIFAEPPIATPSASPVASPIASPIGSGSPSPAVTATGTAP